MKPGVNVQAAFPLRYVTASMEAAQEEHGPARVVVDASKPGGQNGSCWLVVVARRSHPHPAADVGTGLAALESHPAIMQTIWQVLATGMGVVMITTTIAVIIGLCVLLWWTRRID